MIDETTRMVIAARIRHMFESGYIDITGIDQCLKVAGIIPIAKEYQQLRTLHCVYFKQMPRELAEKVPVMLEATFDGLSIEGLLKATQPALENSGKSFVGKLLGIKQ